jgi:hypothetical protein
MSLSDFEIYKESCKTWSDSEVLGEIFFYNLDQSVDLNELDQSITYQLHSVPGLSLKLLIYLEENHVDVMDLVDGLKNDNIDKKRFLDVSRRIASEYRKENNP